MTKAQAGILAPLPEQGRYVFFTLAGSGAALNSALSKLQATAVDGKVVVGIGLQVLQKMGKQLSLMREFPHLKGAMFEAPSTPYALCLWLRSDQRGELLAITAKLASMLAPAFKIDHAVDTFLHERTASGHGRDLTGYEDGTENPEADAAVAASITAGQGEGVDGSSFWALQQWMHDYAAFGRMSVNEQDNTVGLHMSNEQRRKALNQRHLWCDVPCPGGVLARRERIAVG